MDHKYPWQQAFEQITAGDLSGLLGTWSGAPRAKTLEVRASLIVAFPYLVE
jgi:hypothetical protein